MPSLEQKDWAIIGMLGFFIVVALSVELYWVVFYNEMVSRAHTEWLAKVVRVYGDADNSYYNVPTAAAYPRGLESFNIFFTQPLNAWLIWAILARKRYRHALQLILGAYVTYSVLLYFWTAYFSGFERMVSPRSALTYLLFFGANLPWLFGYFYMAYDSVRAFNRQFRSDPAGQGVR
jgi:hypothetical protein